MSTTVDIFEEIEAQSRAASIPAESTSATLLALDIGSSGIRAALFNDQGSEIEGATVRFSYGASTTEFATFDAEALLEQVAQTIDALFARFHQSTKRIELIAISCFWHSLVGVDADGRATTPVLGWADSRARDEVYQLRSEFDEATTHAHTGCRFHPSYWPAKLRRLRNEEPQVFRRTKSWSSFAEYLTLHFFGKTATSVSMASATGLLNQRTCNWDRELLEASGITLDNLPVIADPHQSFRGFTPAYELRWPQLSGARLFPAIGDGAANSIGSGCQTTERVALMIGTSGAMRVCFVGDPPSRLPPELWCYRADRDRIIIGGALSDGGGLYHWLKALLLAAGDFAGVESELNLLLPDAHGLTILPFWAGERSTGWNPDADGAILGLSLKTMPIQIVRAAMEAVAYRFALIARALQPFAPGAALVASGYALRSSPSWVQILADVLGRSLRLSKLSEASMRGAALLALEAAGKIQTIEGFSMPVETVFDPNIAHHARYQQGLDRQERIYKKLFT
ncbi:MAG TPA: gluconokinase [Pyrinomonadaceae bacterium]|nr:gluconokinase [Pyrinomonadaceae bacterium]